MSQDFYRAFIEHAALPHVMVFNYAIPVAQIGVGLFLIAGLLTFPSILVCLFMHINFILSGNMNVISLVLYTSAFLLLLSGNRATRLEFPGFVASATEPCPPARQGASRLIPRSV